MIYRFENPDEVAKFRANPKIEADVCVIGSGAGGSAAAFAAARKGKSVVILERGSFHLPSQMTQREEQMYPELFYEGGGRRTNDFSTRIIHGHGVGGSTLHNINLCKRIPDEMFDHWAQHSRLKQFNLINTSKYYAEIESQLNVHEILPTQVNQANMIFKRGLEQLNYQHGFLKHNREGCVGSGFCELGCAFNAKMNAMRVFIPKVVRKYSGRIYTRAYTQRLLFEGGNKATKAVGLIQTQNIGQGSESIPFEVHARQFIVSGGAIESPALLQRSEIPDPNRLIGSNLHLHPGCAAVGVFDDNIDAWKGIPQSIECTEFLSFKETGKRAWLVLATAHPGASAAILPGFGTELKQKLRSYPKFLAVSVMLHDESAGRVAHRSDGGVSIDYQMGESDCDQMTIGLKAAARVLFAAGAKRVLLPFRKAMWIEKGPGAERQIENIRFTHRSMDVVSVHPMSSLRMGSNTKDSVIGEYGQVHGMENLFVADASVYPTSIGVPPQISTYMTGLWVGEHLA